MKQEHHFIKYLYGKKYFDEKIFDIKQICIF